MENPSPTQQESSVSRLFILTAIHLTKRPQQFLLCNLPRKQILLPQVLGGGWGREEQQPQPTDLTFQYGENFC